MAEHWYLDIPWWNYTLLCLVGLWVTIVLLIWICKKRNIKEVRYMLAVFATTSYCYSVPAIGRPMKYLAPDRYHSLISGDNLWWMSRTWPFAIVLIVIAFFITKEFFKGK